MTCSSFFFVTTVGRQSSLLIKANLRDSQSVLEKLSLGLEFWLLKVERYLIAPSRQKPELVRLSTILTFELTCIELTMKNQKNKLFFTACIHTYKLGGCYERAKLYTFVKYTTSDFQQQHIQRSKNIRSMDPCG